MFFTWHVTSQCHTSTLSYHYHLNHTLLENNLVKKLQTTGALLTRYIHVNRKQTKYSLDKSTRTDTHQARAFHKTKTFGRRLRSRRYFSRARLFRAYVWRLPFSSNSCRDDSSRPVPLGRGPSQLLFREFVLHRGRAPDVETFRARRAQGRSLDHVSTWMGCNERRRCPKRGGDEPRPSNIPGA